MDKYGHGYACFYKRACMTYNQQIYINAHACAHTHGARRHVSIGMHTYIHIRLYACAHVVLLIHHR